MARSVESQGPVVSLTGQEYFDDPHALFTRLRRETPVVRVRADMMIRGTGYLVTTHADVKALHADPRMSSDAFGSMRTGPFARFLPPIVRLLGDTMVMRDDPEHRRLRSIVRSAFTPRLAEEWRMRIDALASEVVGDFVGRRSIDLVEDFAVEFPLRVIAELLGVGEMHRQAFRYLVTEMQRLPTGKLGLVRRLRLMSRLLSLLREVIGTPRAPMGSDLVSAVLDARDGAERLTEREALAMVFLLFYAGHDTTSNMLSGSMVELMRNRGAMASLRAADHSYRAVAVEELLRHVSPVACGSVRKATEDVEIGGVRIPAGAQILGMVMSANRDETVFRDAAELHLDRTVNPHLSFGFGPHLCLGAHLARIEIAAGLSALIETFPDIDVEDPRAPLSYRRDLSMRSLRALPVRLG